MGFAILFAADGATARGAQAAGDRAPRAGNTQFIFLDMTPLGSYEVQKNQSAFLSTGASPAGSVSFRDATNSGDQFILTFTGVSPFPPSQPANLTAAGQSDGCARLTWTTPPASEYVSDYRIYWGLVAGTYTDSTTVDLLRVVKAGGNSSVTVCGFIAGTYYFAIRARNQFDLWSPISNEDQATISGSDPQGPPAPQNVAVTEDEPGCGLVSWSAVGDPTVTGYRVFVGTSSVAQGQAAAYDDSLDAGSNTSAQICGLSAGTHYFAVKSLTAGGASSVYSTEVSRTLVGPDTDGPVLLSSVPADGATGVAINTTVCFEISDARSGIDLSTLEVLIDGAAPSSVATLGDGTTYYVQTLPAAYLPPNSTIDVSVTVADLASPANVSVLTWSFDTSDFQVVDTTPPAIAAVRPRPDDTAVDPLSAVVISITDGGMGVDVSSLALFVDDAPATFSVEGTPLSLTVRYEHPGGFAPGATVALRMEACDLAAVANCASPLTMSFTVAGGALASTAQGAIVPDGFWAGDSDRPLEVRNLPIHWTIRIFDAAGQQVRRFRNTTSEGFTWIWDFTNDHGSRVAHALYLVRVIDAGGSVRQTGRFVVQTDR